MNKKRGFTLTEVLITMGVIGVISALTVPTLMNNYQQKALSIQARKAVLDLETQVDLLITEEGKSNMAATNIKTQAGFTAFLREHFKVTRTCAQGSASGCFAAQSYLSISGTSTALNCASESYLLSNSVAICPTKAANSVTYDLYIDVNGSEGPNVGGRDMFHVSLRPDGKIHDNTVAAGVESCTGDSFGAGCLDRLQQNNWIMDY